MTKRDHAYREASEEDKKDSQHLTVRPSDPGNISLSLCVAIRRPKRSGYDRERARSLKKHLLSNRIRSHLIHGQEAHDEERIDLKESDIAELEYEEADPILVNARGRGLS